MKKRILSLFLAFAMAATLAPVSSLVKSTEAEAAVPVGKGVVISAVAPAGDAQGIVLSKASDDGAGVFTSVGSVSVNPINSSGTTAGTLTLTMVDENGEKIATGATTKSPTFKAINEINGDPDNGAKVAAMFSVSGGAKFATGVVTVTVGSDGDAALAKAASGAYVASGDYTIGVYDDPATSPIGTFVVTVNRGVIIDTTNKVITPWGEDSKAGNLLFKKADDGVKSMDLPKITDDTATGGLILGWQEDGVADDATSYTKEVKNPVVVNKAIVESRGAADKAILLDYDASDASIIGKSDFTEGRKSTTTAPTYNAFLDVAANPGTSDIKLPKLTRSGYIFDKWVVVAPAAIAGEFRTASTKFASWGADDLELKALWKTSKVTIKYNHNDGTRAVTEKAASVDGTYIFPYGAEGKVDAGELPIYRPGYELVAWNNQANEKGDVTVYPGGKLTSTVLDSLKAKANSTINLYAVWKPVKYKITYNFVATKTTSANYSDDGTAGKETVDVSLSTEKLEATALKLGLEADNQTQVFANQGYNLIGWAIEKEDAENGIADFATNALITENILKEADPTSTRAFDLYAVWKPITYTVKFNKNETKATGSMETITRTVGTPNQQLPGSAFRYGSYVMENWASDVDGDDVVGLQGATWDVDVDVAILDAAYDANKGKKTTVANLYANWSDDNNYYIVDFLNADGSIFAMMGSEKGSETCELPATDPLRTGYTFDHWEKYNGEAIKGQVEEVKGNTKIYPTWEENTYSIGYDVISGVTLKPVSYKISETPVTLPVPQDNQQVFKAWKVKSVIDGDAASRDLIGTLINEIPEGTVGNLELQAIWLPIFRSAKFTTGDMEVEYSTPQDRIERVLQADIYAQDFTNNRFDYNAIVDVDWSVTPEYDPYNTGVEPVEYTFTGVITLDPTVVGNAGSVSVAARTVTKKVIVNPKASDANYVVLIEDFYRSLPADVTRAAVRAAIFEIKQVDVYDEEGKKHTFIVSFSEDAVEKALADFDNGYTHIVVESDEIENIAGEVEFPETYNTAYLDLYIGTQPVAPVDPEPEEPEFVAPEPDKTKVDNESGRTWRLLSKKSGAHHITASAAEKDMLVAAGWELEDGDVATHYVYAKGYVEYLAKSLAYAAYNAGSEKTEEAYNDIYDECLANVCEALNIKAVWRYLRANGDHHFTSSLEEMALIDKGSSIKEGIAFFVIDDKENPTYDESENSLIDIIRYNNTRTQIHHFVQANNKVEIDMLAAAPNFEREGIAWEGFTSDVQDMELIEDIDKLIEIIELLDAIVDDVVEEA